MLCHVMLYDVLCVFINIYIYTHIFGFYLLDVPFDTRQPISPSIPILGGYGMEFGLNENITQLARRNDKTQAFQLLLTLEQCGRCDGTNYTGRQGHCEMNINIQEASGMLMGYFLGYITDAAGGAAAPAAAPAAAAVSAPAALLCHCCFF